MFDGNSELQVCEQRKWILSKHAFLKQERFYQKETGFF